MTLKIVLAALILAGGMTASAYVLSRFFVNVRNEHDIYVKGYSERPVRADLATISATVSVAAHDLTELPALLDRDAGRLTGWIEGRGLRGAVLERRPANFNTVYKRDSQGRITNEVDYHAASQTVQVTAPDPEGVRGLSLGWTALVGEGLRVSVSSPEYLVSTLEEAKRELLGRATEDGRARAEVIAQKSGARVGRLTSASQGVFQVTQPNSTEVSSYGQYDTATIDKVLKLVLTLEFEILK